MYYVLVFFVGLIQGAISLYLAIGSKVKKLKAQEADLEQQRIAVQAAHDKSRQRDSELTARQAEIEINTRELKKRSNEFDAKVVSYTELLNENLILKRDLQNVDVSVNKLQLDVEVQATRQSELDVRSVELAQRYLAETVKAVAVALNPSNFTTCKQRLLDVIERCRGIGFAIESKEEQRLVSDLKNQFERVVRMALEREEQARINAQIREEQKLQREIDRELKQLEREKAAIEAALDQALAKAKNLHTAEVQLLEGRLAEAEAKTQRAISMAQQTKAGNVYVISNIGSFGENVFKIGMSRRLEPLERVRELGGASVPFPFDVHMMIATKDAPALESALHRILNRQRINRTNPRKEFFKADIETIRNIVQEHHGEVVYTASPEALEYRQSLSMSEDDAQFIESVYDAATDDSVVTED